MEGEAADAIEPARQALQLEAHEVLPVRITCKGNDVTVQVNNVVAHASHAIIGSKKCSLIFWSSARALDFGI